MRTLRPPGEGPARSQVRFFRRWARVSALNLGEGKALLLHRGQRRNEEQFPPQASSSRTEACFCKHVCFLGARGPTPGSPSRIFSSDPCLSPFVSSFPFSVLRFLLLTPFLLQTSLPGLKTKGPSLAYSSALPLGPALLQTLPLPPSRELLGAAPSPPAPHPLRTVHPPSHQVSDGLSAVKLRGRV